MRISAKIVGTPMEIVAYTTTKQEFLRCEVCGVQLEATTRDEVAIEEFLLDHTHESEQRRAVA